MNAETMMKYVNHDASWNKHKGAKTVESMTRFKDQLDRARPRGEVPPDCRSEKFEPRASTFTPEAKPRLRWTPTWKVKKAKSETTPKAKTTTKAKAKVKAPKSTVDLFELISLVRDSGEYDKLTPHCEGVTIKQLLEWHEQEQWAREQAAIRG